jgi:hypothetical protein
MPKDIIEEVKSKKRFAIKRHVRLAKDAGKSKRISPQDNLKLEGSAFPSNGPSNTSAIKQNPAKRKAAVDDATFGRPKRQQKK